ncbi:MAG: hypothetical protein SAJ12_00410 [Jaaginema sp. PMC 1079.18]|nr:hypothetical protein [Jaaginema sp. PMC 1080.18]MEC4849445.1 hypothetical protein [Jaaginema sp. PMC 1079.18]MEC4865456.1 hypothetical protein [Jaaginema sp. PMC 1078.18]
MKPKFSTLIILTFVCVALLTPFAFSPIYVETLREEAFNLLMTFQGNLYKQVTGFMALAFVFLEMVLTVRKRSRSWKFKITLPGSMQFWRSLHIFAGVGLLALVLIHTIGVNGLNFNAVFLWVFFFVTLSALVGVVAETGLVESPQRYFGFKLAKAGKVEDSGQPSGIPKGKLIRGLRSLWLTTHIFLVSVFCVMLVIHIFLAYYYQ